MTLEEMNKENSDREPKEETFWSRHGANIGLVVLIIYVILLAIGTAAEIFEIDSILNWWIFRPPGRH
ncbi:MAG: hypothetical protein OEV42_19640 [Deltaproteobacteria bacterium]|nr:hypothetical protein [Deltaproteobacteria bacterium]